MIEMERDRRVRIYALHSWTGIVLGFLIYLVCLTGTFAVFHAEIALWQDPEARLAVADAPVPIHPLVTDWVDQTAPDKEIPFLSVFLPSSLQPYYAATVFYREEDGHIHHEHRYWDTTTGQPIELEGDGLSHWVLEFHQDFFWPDRLGGHTIGEIIIGLAGLFLMLSILSGVLTHRKLIKELFTLRSRRNPRVAWKDAHNVFGVWGLPFHFTIALTGAFLGIVSLMLPILAVLAFGGDIERVTELLSDTGEPAGIAAPMISLDDVAIERHPESGQPIHRLFVEHWGDRNARYTLNFDVDGEILLGQQRIISGVTGEPLPMGALNPEYAVAPRVLAMMSALHYGTFGDLPTKLLYFVLGLLLSAVIAFGMVVWIERRSGSSLGGQSPIFYIRMRKLIAGFCLGLLWANIAIFYHDLFYAGAESKRLFWTGTAYFSSWLFAIVLAQVVSTPRAALNLLLWVSALAFFALPFVHAAITGDGFWQLGAMPNTVSAWVDITMLILALVLAWVAWYSGGERARSISRSAEQDSLDTAVS